MHQLGIHVCRRGTPVVDFIYRTLHVPIEHYEMIRKEDLDALLSFDVNCKRARKEIHDSIIEVYGSLENIDLVATNVGFTGVLH